jgi:hypothetical protein
MSTASLQGSFLEHILQRVLMVLLAATTANAEWQQVTVAGLANSTHMTATDLDGDGDQDLLVASSSFGVIGLINPGGRGSGWVQNSISASALLAKGPQGDVDGDGDPDVLAISGSAPLWFENRLEQSLPWLSHPIPGVTALNRAFSYDMDGDGDQDLVYITDQYRDIAWLENQGNGSFWVQHPVLPEGTDRVQDMRILDLDEDGDPDLLCCIEHDSDYTDSIVWHENPDGGDSPWAQHPVFDLSLDHYTDMDTGDVDNDGDMDLLLVVRGYEHVDNNWINLLSRTGPDTWTPSVIQISNAEYIQYHASGFADFDADGDLDIFRSLLQEDYAWEHPPEIGLLENRFGAFYLLPVDTLVYQSQIMDAMPVNLDGDDFPDLVYLFNGTIHVYFAPNPIRVITPVPGAEWPSGSRKQILWFQPIAAPARVSLVSADSLRQVILSDSSQANAGGNNRFVTVPAVPVGDYHIAVETLDGTMTYAGRMAGEIEVTGSLTLLTHNDGAPLVAGSPQVTRWSNRWPEPVSLQLLLEGEAVDTLGTSADSVFQWTVPFQPLADGYLLHISTRIGDVVYEDTGALPFELLTPIQCVHPQAGSLWRTGTSHTVSWLSSAPSPVSIELWNNGLWQADIASGLPASGSFEWTIPPLPVTIQARLRLRTTVEGIEYTADSPLFGLVNPVELLEPVDGQQLLPGSSVAVHWEATVGTQVNLQLGLPDGQWLTIADSTANDGEFQWTVPFLPPGGNHVIRIETTAGGFVYIDSSGTGFELGNPLECLGPEDGSTVPWNQFTTVAWEIAFDQPLELRLSRNGQDLGILGTADSGAGHWEWLPGLRPSGPGYRLHLSVDADGQTYQDSSGVFTLQGPGLVLHPVHTDTAEPCFVDLSFQVCDGMGRGIAFLDGLDPFVIRENGNAVVPGESFPLFERIEATPLDQHILLLMDNSFSIGIQLEGMRAAARRAVRSLSDGQQLGLWTFAEELVPLHGFSSDSTTLLAAIDGITLGPASSDVFGAILQAAGHMAEPLGADGVTQHSLLLMTDARDTQGSATAEEALAAVQGRQVFTLAFGADPDTVMLAALGTAGFVREGETGLPPVFAWISDQLQDFSDSFYRIAYASASRNNPDASAQIELTDNPQEWVLDMPFNSTGFQSVIPGIRFNRDFDHLLGIEDVLLDPPGSVFALDAVSLYGLFSSQFQWQSTDTTRLVITDVSGQANEQAQLHALTTEPFVITVLVSDSPNGFSREITVRNGTGTGIGDEVTVPRGFSLDPVFPNPFNARCTVTLQLGTAAKVDVSLFNLLGQRVLQLVSDEDLLPGTHRWTLSAEELASGVYLVRASSAQGDSAGRMVLLVK